MARAAHVTGWPRVKRWLLRALWIVPSAALVLVVVLLLALNLGPTRKFVSARVNTALSEQFAGRVELERIGSLRVDAISGIDARVLDASGRRVLSVRGLSLRSNWPEIVQALVLGRPLRIVLSPLDIDHVEVLLIGDAQGTPTLASAFNPRKPSPPSTSSEADATSFAIGRLHVRHIWAHGSLPSVPVLDAELMDLRGSFEQGKAGLSAKLDQGRLVTRALPARVDPNGALKARFAQTAAKAPVRSGFAEFRGTLAAAPTTLRAELKGQQVDALLQSPAVPAATVRQFLPSSKLEATTTLEASVQGTLPELAFSARLQNPSAEARVEGHASLEDTTRISAEVHAAGVDLQGLLGTTPATHLSLEATARVALASDGSLNGDYRLTAPSGRFGDQVTPALSSAGKLSRDKAGTLRGEGELEVKEPGAATQADYRVELAADGSGSLHTELSSELRAPPRLKRLAELTASGSISATSDLDLKTLQLSARATGKLEKVVHPSVRLDALDLTLNVRGPASAPALALRADARNVSAAERRFRTLKLSAQGDQSRLQVAVTGDAEQNQRFQANARLLLGEVLVIEEPSLDFRDREGTITASARNVRVASGTVRVDELRLSGLGEARATGSIAPQRINAEFETQALDLGRISRLTGLGFAKRGTLTLTGKVAGPLSDLAGKVKGQAREVEFKELRGGAIDLDLELSGRRLNGELQGKLGRSQLQASLSDVDVPAPPFTAQKLRALRGALRMNGQVELSEVSPVLRAANVPLERARGRVLVTVTAAHARTSEAEPRLEAHVQTQGLSLVGQRSERENVESPRQAVTAEPFSLEGIDGDVRVTVDPENELARADVILSDRTGSLVTANAEARVAGLSTLRVEQRFEDLPVKLTIRTPERVMEKLPSAIRPSVMRGIARVELDAQGTLQDPEVRATVSVRRLRARDGRNWVDLEASAEYKNQGGLVQADARATRGGGAGLRVNWAGDLARRARTASSNRPSPLDLNADLVLDKFPIALIPDVSDNQVRGPLSGEVRLRGLGKNAKLEATFDGSGMKVNRIAMPALKASLRADEHELMAKFEAVQSKGSARAEFSAPSAWGARWAPELTSRAKVNLQARAFELEALAPLVARYVSALEGQLDANLSAELDPEAPNLQGSATLKDGVFQLPALGQRFSDVRAKVTARDGELRVDGLQARGITGRVTGEARAKLVGTSLQAASARVDISEKEKLPITFEGVMIGDAWGHATLAYSHTGENQPTEIKVDVPAFRLQMPDAAQNSVQDLDPADDIRIGTVRSDGKFAAVPMQPFEVASTEDASTPPSLTRTKIHLGDSVWVERGRQATVQLTGDMEILSGAENEIAGRIELRGGKLDVSGKRFEIERGVISFEGDDPANPTVTATARWDSPAEYTVYAEYVGTVKDGKLKLRSEPPLTQDEILSLLLFGQPGGGAGGGSQSSDPNAAGTAVSVAGDTATRGLNRAISDVTSLDVSTRIDTSTGSARPELVVQLTPRLTSRLTRAIGDPAPGESPDRTFITLELRLLRSWAISGTVGDHGRSALDLIWRNRY